MSQELRAADFQRHFFFLLDEFFEGPPAGADGTAVLDRTGSWRHTLQDVSAAEASREAFPGATTVAAQVAHTTFYLTNALRYLRPGGDTSARADWPGSWSRRLVTDPEWVELRAALFVAYQDVRDAVETMAEWSGEAPGDAMAALAHSAYHLGAVRQLVRALRSSEPS